MKRTYSNPSLEVIKIATQQMLALSNDVFGGGSGNTSSSGVTSGDGRGGDLDDDF